MSGSTHATASGCTPGLSQRRRALGDALPAECRQHHAPPAAHPGNRRGRIVDSHSRLSRVRQKWRTSHRAGPVHRQRCRLSVFIRNGLSRGTNYSARRIAGDFCRDRFGFAPALRRINSGSSVHLSQRRGGNRHPHPRPHAGPQLQFRTEDWPDHRRPSYSSRAITTRSSHRA